MGTMLQYNTSFISDGNDDDRKSLNFFSFFFLAALRFCFFLSRINFSRPQSPPPFHPLSYPKIGLFLAYGVGFTRFELHYYIFHIPFLYIRSTPLCRLTT